MNWNALKEKKWGLPLYVWAAIAALLIIGIYMIFRRRNNTASSGAGTVTDTTPADASQAAQDYSSDAGTGGGLGVPNSPNVGADTTTGSVIPETIPTNLDLPTTTTTTVVPAAPMTKSTSTASKSVVTSQVVVPSNATATSLQKSVAPVGPSGVLVPSTPTRVAQTNHPAAVKATANKTGASGNKAQGVFAIH